MSVTHAGPIAGPGAIDCPRLGKVAFTAVLACFLCQVVMALAVIPPWQNPDEPQHFMTVRMILAHGPNFTLEMADPATERAVVASMARYGWWTHYGLATPNPLPATFADGPALVVHDYFGPPSGGSRLYYRAVAALVRAAGIDDLLWQLYTMRVLSALATMLTLWCAWRGTLLLLGDRSALVVSSLLLLHPQFLLVSTTASPDAFVNLAGAAFWWRAGVLLTADVSLLNIVSVWAAAILAFVIRRMGAPLLIVALGATATRLLWAMSRGDRRRIAAVLAASLALAAVVGVSWRFLPADVHLAFAWIQFDPGQSFAKIVEHANGLPNFFDMLFTTFWLSAGWLRYPGPAWWTDLAIGLTAFAAIGIVTRAAIPIARHPAVWLAASMALLQFAVVVAYDFGILQSGPQGRYLFPVMPAILSLVWLGWRRWFVSREPMAAVALVLLAALLNATAWILVIVPAYA